LTDKLNIAVINFIPWLVPLEQLTNAMLCGVAEQMGDLEHAFSAYENALQYNPILLGLPDVAGNAQL